MQMDYCEVGPFVLPIQNLCRAGPRDGESLPWSLEDLSAELGSHEDT